MARSFRTAAWPVALLLTLLGVSAPVAQADPGLLLIAHGSPSASWNQPVLDFGNRVADAVRKGKRFRAVRTAMLEAGQPDIPAAVAQLEAEGCDRIVAVPLFIAPTGHTHFDVPAALGIFFSPRTAESLKQEGVHAAQPKVPVVLTATLAESDVLAEFVADQVRKLSRSPQEEALVILTHGDPDHELLVERLMRRIATQVCGQSGIRYADWAYVGMGQEYPTRGLPAIHEAIKRKRRVLVVGVYLATSAQGLHQRAAAHGRRAAEPFPGEVVFSGDTLLAHPALLEWVVAVAHAPLASCPAQTTSAAAGPPAGGQAAQTVGR